ncbi:MAG: hypothetical protein RL385_991 [Pseudomonadota bacterium]|jgi:hypothetical protein
MWRNIETVAFLCCLASSAAGAQGYAGVVPGASNVPDRIAAQPGEAALVTWPGFQVLPSGGSRVFIQTSVEVKSELKREGMSFVLVLSGVGLPAGNNRLPLDTHFFNTPMASLRTKLADGGHAVSVTMQMRAEVTPVLRTERAANGYYFTYVDFPPGQYLRSQGE